MKRAQAPFLGLFASLMLNVGCVTLHAPPAGTAAIEASEANKKSADEAWVRVLKRHVDKAGRVDFAGVAKDRKDLDRYVSFVANAGPSNRPELYPSATERMAYYLNSYNALAMYGILAEGIPQDFDSFTKRLSFFKLTEYQVAGRAISPFDYENAVIRPLGDARVHFALNCMSVGCPRLPQTPFGTDDLDKELDAAAREFFGSPKYLQVDAGAKVVKVSEILKFYTEDFVGDAGSLIGYINKYAPEKVPESFEVEWIPYDWTVNRQ